MPDVTTLRIIWTSNHGQAIQGIKSVENASNNFVSRAGASLVGFLTRDLIRGTMAAVAGLFNVGAQFQDSMNMFQAASQATDAEMSRVSAKARELGEDLTLPKTSAADAAGAMTELTKAGFGVQTSMDAARAALLLAAAANMEEAEAAELVGNTMNAFNLKGTEAIKVADYLAAASLAASGDVTDMSVALRYAAGAAARTGISLDETITAIGLMSQKAIQGSLAGTAFRQMLQRLQAPTKKTKELLAELGISAYNTGGDFVGLRSLVEQFSTKLQGTTRQYQDYVISTIFGARAGAAANFVLMGGVAAYDAMFDAIHRTNAAQEIAEARNKGVKGAWDALISRIEDGAIALFTFSQGAMRDFLINIAEVVPSLIDFAGAMFRYIAPAAREVATALGLVAEGLMHAIQFAAPVAAAFGAIVGTALLAFIRTLAIAIQPLARLFAENEVAARLLAGAMLAIAAPLALSAISSLISLLAGVASIGLWPARRALLQLIATFQSFSAASALGISRVTIALAGLRAVFMTVLPIAIFAGISYMITKIMGDTAKAKEASRDWVDGLTVGIPTAEGKLIALNNAIEGLQQGISKKTSFDELSESGRRLNATLEARKGITQQIAEETARATEEQKRAYLQLATVAGTATAELAANAGLGTEAVNQMTEAAKKFEDGVTKSFMSATSVVEAFGDDAEVTAAKVMKFFEDQVEAARNWSSNLKALAKAGLDEGLLAELAQAGPKAAPLVKALLDAVKSGNLEAINQAQADLREILDDTLTSLSNKEGDFNAQGGVIGQNFVDGLKAKQDAAAAAGRALALSAVSEMETWQGRARDFGYSVGSAFAGGVASGVGTYNPATGMGEIGHYATGGIVRKPTLAWVGEKAPEVVLPMDDPGRAFDLLRESGLLGLLSPGQKKDLIPSEMRTTGSGASYAGGSTTVVNVYNAGSVTTDRDLQESIRAGLIRNGSRQGSVNSYLALRR